MTAQQTVAKIPRDLRDLDGRRFNAESYNRWKKANFDDGVARGANEERKRIRRAIAPHLRSLRHPGDGNRKCPCANCKALDAIKRATRAPRKGRR